MLADLVPAKLADLLEEIRVTKYHNLDAIDAKIDDWSARGAEVIPIGTSKQGRAIRAVRVGTGSRTVLAWGYPHPDEPYGAESLIVLIDWVLDGKLQGVLEDWSFVCVVCADPDEFSRQKWIKGERTLENFLGGAWRPTHIGHEIDYGFPVNWGPFCYPPADFIGRCRTKSECLQNCGPDGCKNAGKPFSPLPESLALADAMKRFRPDIVASLHSTHTGGDYTFLLRKEDDETVEKLLAVPDAAGTGRHLGEPIDRGKRWKKYVPDLIKERGLKWQEEWLKNTPDYTPGSYWVMNHSAAQFMESILPNSQFLCPETTQFRHPDFSDSAIFDERIKVMTSVEDRRKGRYRMTRVSFRGEWKVAQQVRADNELLSEAEIVEVPVTRGILGSLAVFQRRLVLAEMDEIWDSLDYAPGQFDHPYPDMKTAITTPGAYVCDRSLLIFRTAEQYRRPPTKAQAASLRWLWPIHTATYVANFRNFLTSVEQTPEVINADRRLRKLQQREMSALPQSMLREGPIEPAVRSVLARLFVLMLARD